MCPGYKEPKRGFTELFKVDSSQILKKETRADQLKMIIASFKSCPYMSKGETINVASWGCNPYMYITDDVMPNPYDKLPTYYKQEVAALAATATGLICP